MKFCTSCGRDNEESVNFCTGCGRQLEDVPAQTPFNPFVPSQPAAPFSNATAFGGDLAIRSSKVIANFIGAWALFGFCMIMNIFWLDDMLAGGVDFALIVFLGVDIFAGLSIIYYGVILILTPKTLITFNGSEFTITVRKGKALTVKPQDVISVTPKRYMSRSRKYRDDGSLIIQTTTETIKVRNVKQIEMTRMNFENILRR